ncbi:TRANSPARENT TESTA 7, CYTOCHROME P450 75B1 [Hibiscus trionum]|uniref:TRANSPARENT TESTA 7, CYTOCHROME P450 75B1 n=1 Tax=Hibiscus trionum TaxID=183268 RepID=A0A9W7J8J7_HIBTR|nr:TRANSPARENT TESTA 7, CYTOCHROME P450 75B1 [Hibiscus trionum]
MSSTLALLLVLLGTLCSFIYFFRTPNHHKDRRKLPPGPAPFPIIGNLYMLGKLPHQSLHHLAKTHGPIMSIKLGYVPTIVVSSPEAAELFLRVHDVVFASRPKVQSAEYLTCGAKGLGFTEYGSYWRTVRKWCVLHLLSASKVECFAPVRKAEMGSLVELVRKKAAAGETLNLSQQIGQIIEAIMSKVIFGRCMDAEIEFKPLIEDAMYLAGVFNLSDYVPFLAPFDLQGIKRRLKRTSNGLHAIFDKLIDEHERGSKNIEEKKSYTDFFHVMVSLLNTPINPNKEEQPYIIGRENIKAILSDMVAASFETTATAIEWTFSELLRHPRVMASLQQELESVAGRNRMIEESDLPKLTYLDMVIKESFRLHPVAPLLVPHQSTQDITVNGYFIPKKSRILVNAWSIGRDHKVWSDNAEEFFPERFEDSNIDLRGHDFQLIPFGTGRRGCPGMQLGLTTTRLIIAQLVHCFAWELPDGISPEELDMTEKFGLTLPRANNLLAMPTYRLVA